MARRKGEAHPNYTHGLSKHPLHKVWSSIKERCSKEDSRDYAFYGARGIQLYGEWENDFLRFFEWSLANGYEKGLTIDRIDNDGHYKPSNCRWVSRSVQNRNMSTNRQIEINGVQKCLADWLDTFKLNRQTFYSRMAKGMDEVEALTKPARKRVKVNG